MASQNGLSTSVEKSKVPVPSNEDSAPNNGSAEHLAEPSAGTQAQTSEDWTSERRQISALATLQEMDTKIHQLRTLVPDRVLGPLRPIVAEDKESMPKSPPDLFEQLAQTARDSISEIDSFKSMWHQPEMKAIWDRVNQRLKETGEDHPQPGCVWERDYSMMLRKLDREEARRRERAKLESEQAQRELSASAPGGWKRIVESFIGAAKPGLTINVLPSTDDLAQFSVLLHNISAQFLVRNHEVKKAGDWEVSIKSSGSASKTLDGILHCINNRGRKWDLQYLLDMAASYVQVKKSPCTNCNRLLDSNAQLPTFRKPKPLDPTDADPTFEWEPYHPRCL